jgi:putative ABC transport system permease protein
MTRPFSILRNLTKGRQLDEDLERELSSCVDLLAAEKERSGIGPAQARRAALIELGGVEQNKEGVRAVRAGAAIGQLFADVRYAVRGIRRNPGFSAVVILSIALGIGVNSTAFSSVRWLILQPFPFADVDRIVTVWSAAEKSGGRDPVSAADFFDLADTSRSFESIAAWRRWDAAMTGSGEPLHVRGQLVTQAFFTVLGVKPWAGRGFKNDDIADEVVVSYAFWKTRLASSPEAVGQTIELNRKSYTMIGIMPEDVEYPLETDVWAPLVFSPLQKAERADRSLAVFGRLRPGVTTAECGADLKGIAQRLQRRFPATNESRTVETIQLIDTVNGGGVASRFVEVLFAAALFVMLLVCVNLANLLLARAMARQKEMGVRMALGAGRLRIARQLLTEIFLLSLLGAVAGVVLGYWDLRELKAYIPGEVIRWMPGLRRMRMDPGTVAFACALSLVSGFVSNLPALLQVLGRWRPGRILETLQQAGRSNLGSGSRTRFRNAIVVVESALALLLLVGAGLMAKTFRHMAVMDRGYDTSNVLTMQTALPESRYGSEERVRAFYERVVGGLAGTPGVRSAAADAFVESGAVRIEGRAAPPAGEPETPVYAITPEYFSVLRMALRSGRTVAASDSPDAPRIAVISASLARRYWPAGNAVGERIGFGKSPEWFTVAGVVSDTRDWFSGEPEPRAYVAFAQQPQRSSALLLRTDRDPFLLTADARRAVYQADPVQPVFELDSMEHRLSVEMSGVRNAAFLMGIYALIALVLAVTGIYSLSSYVAAQRTPEMGLRIALGAVRRDILLLSLGQSARLAAAGLAIGLAASFALARFMSSRLYGVVDVDGKTFVEVTALLALCVLAATSVPAWRASRTDPVVALRHE